MIKKIFTITILFVFMIAFKQLQAKESEIKVVAFDFGGVIGTSNKQDVVQFIVQSLNISKREAKDIVQEMKDQRIDAQNEEAFWKAYAKKNKIVLPHNWLEKLNNATHEALEENPGMLNLVKSLQKEGYQTALLSNVGEKKAKLYHEVGFYNLFQPLILSHEIGIKKPDHDAYLILLDALQASPEEVLFVDNKQRNIDAAKELGMEGVLFTSRDQLIKELKQKKIRVSTTQ